jgi:hypothetical protein
MRLLVWLVLPIVVVTGSITPAEGEPAEKPGVVERIDDTAEKVGNKIEKGFTKAAKKIEQKKLGEKLERKLRKAATKTAEGFKKAGNKIEKKLNQ